MEERSEEEALVDWSYTTCEFRVATVQWCSPRWTYVVLGQEVPRAEELIVFQIKRPRSFVVVSVCCCCAVFGYFLRAAHWSDWLGLGMSLCG